MTVYTFPQNVYPFDAQLTVVGASDTFVARPGTTQTQRRAGSHWTMRVDFRNMSDDQWDELEGFVAKINGREHRIRTPIWARRRIRGDIKTNSVALAAGRVRAASRSDSGDTGFLHRGTMLGTTGWGTVVGRKLLRVGDLIEIRYPDRTLDSTTTLVPDDSSQFIESRMHRITEDVDWNANPVLNVWPPITVPPTDGAHIIVLRPHETWIMTNNPAFSDQVSMERKTSIVLATDLLTGLRI